MDAARERKPRRAKARLVILGYEDPDVTNIPRFTHTSERIQIPAVADVRLDEMEDREF